MYKKVLVVIDMQPEFLDESDPIDNKIIYNVAELVRHARQNNWFIIIMELVGCGDTFEHITCELDNYKNSAYLFKRQNSGASHIIKYFDDIDTKIPKDFVVCGVNGDMCVADTISDMLCECCGINVTMINDASNCETGLIHSFKSGYKEKQLSDVINQVAAI